MMKRSKPPMVVGGGEMKRDTSSVVSIAISDAASLKGLCAEFGLDPAEAEDVWNDPDWKAHLKEANDAAIARGVFGAPFFIIDGEPFWGNDRRAQIERWLEKGPF